MTKNELALELLKISEGTLYHTDDKTVEKVVAAYNYIYENIIVDENLCDKE